MDIRLAKSMELNKIMEIYAYARKFMAAHDNPTQWGNTKPSRERIEQDIKEGKCHVCVEDGEIVAVFYFAKEKDSTYAKIENGKWLNEEDYAVVHRIASAGTVKGAGSFCMQWAASQADNVRIDTHENNYVMQNMLKKNGFVHCGTIFLEDGEPRLAFHKVCK